MRYGLVLGVLLATASTGCGTPVAGDGCGGSGYLCEDEDNAIECRGGRWTAILCRGPNGCQRVGDLILCDMTGSVAGDLCGSTMFGTGLCAPDKKAVLECRNGVLVTTKTCSDCTTSSTDVTCVP
jgi:hypothetical protein